MPALIIASAVGITLADCASSPAQTAACRGGYAFGEAEQLVTSSQYAAWSGVVAASTSANYGCSQRRQIGRR